MRPEEIIIRFVVTEKAIKLMEENNTITIIVNINATKKQIKEAFEKLYNAKVKKVNTLITIYGEKKAYIKLFEEYKAEELASKVGVI
ncbi:MAG: 50S ribosomal protein L23 [Thermoprotei archaeon]|nr:MAG: 50S ribosomal protein L23 [Thermoprotei archaeon]